MRLQVRSLASLSGLRIWHCRELWHRLHVVVVVVVVIVAISWAAPAAYGGSQARGCKTTINVAHNLGTEDVTITVREVATKQVVMADVQIYDSNNIDVLFASAPASGAYRIVIIG